MARELSARVAHPGFELGDERARQLPPNRQPLSGRAAVDGALDIEDRIDPGERIAGERRDDDLLVLRAPCERRHVDELKERPSCMAPAQRAQERLATCTGSEQGVVARIGIGLDDAVISVEMRKRMLAAPVTRIVEDGSGRRRTSERAIVADIGP